MQRRCRSHGTTTLLAFEGLLLQIRLTPTGALQAMTFRLQRFQHGHRHETGLNTGFLCYGANHATKLASTTCAGAHKAAVSQFGQVKLHLKSDPLKKVILSHSSERARPSGAPTPLVEVSSVTSSAGNVKYMVVPMKGCVVQVNSSRRMMQVFLQQFQPFANQSLNHRHPSSACV